MKYIYFISILLLNISCNDTNEIKSETLDFDFKVSAFFDSSYIYIKTKLVNNSNSAIYIPADNWIVEAKSYKGFVFFRKPPDSSYIYNSLYFYTENDNPNNEFGRAEMIDFQSINSFIRVNKKDTANINYTFSNRKILFSECAFLLYKDNQYNLILNMTILDESEFRLVSKLVMKNESQISIDSSSEINYFYGDRNSNTLYSGESMGLSKYNYAEKLELSELFQKNKHLFTLSQIGFHEKEKN